jgi:hypothetical protein
MDLPTAASHPARRSPPMFTRRLTRSAPRRRSGRGLLLSLPDSRPSLAVLDLGAASPTSTRPLSPQTPSTRDGKASGDLLPRCLVSPAPGRNSSTVDLRTLSLTVLAPSAEARPLPLPTTTLLDRLPRLLIRHLLDSREFLTRTTCLRLPRRLRCLL